MIRFDAYDLSSKAGFGDGDMLDDTLYDLYNFTDRGRGDHHLWFEHEVLARCVERYLLPKLPPVATSRIVTSHNPIRADEEYHQMLRDCGVYVDVEEEVVLGIAAEVAAERDFGAKAS